MPTLEEIERPKYEEYCLSKAQGYEKQDLELRNGKYVDYELRIGWSFWMARAALEPKWEPVTEQHFRDSEIHDFYPGDSLCVSTHESTYFSFKLPELPK